MKRKLSAGIAVLCALGAMMLCLALASCSRAPSYAENFTGTWDVVTAESTVGSFAGTDFENLERSGFDVHMTFNADGTATYSLYGEEHRGTWQAQSETTAVFDCDELRYSFTLHDDGRLEANAGEAILTFERR